MLVFTFSLVSQKFMLVRWTVPFNCLHLAHGSEVEGLDYTHLVSFEGDEYHTATSKSLKEDEELLKAGFEYVTEREGVKIYRKRK